MSTDPDQIRAEIERTRAELSQDVDALGEKVSPSAIVERRKERLMDKVTSVKERVMGSASEPAMSSTTNSTDVTKMSRFAPCCRPSPTPGCSIRAKNRSRASPLPLARWSCSTAPGVKPARCSAASPSCRACRASPWHRRPPPDRTVACARSARAYDECRQARSFVQQLWARVHILADGGERRRGSASFACVAGDRRAAGH